MGGLFGFDQERIQIPKLDGCLCLFGCVQSAAAKVRSSTLMFLSLRCALKFNVDESAWGKLGLAVTGIILRVENLKNHLDFANDMIIFFNAKDKWAPLINDTRVVNSVLVPIPVWSFTGTFQRFGQISVPFQKNEWLKKKL